ncbi:MAG: hypothetical protein IKR49_10700 [Clostridia bacterium]|nr:hypothetical protein [Clostridia bacterium]
MKLLKSAQVQTLALTEDDLEQINRHTLRAFNADELYAFKLLMCDNEIDRDDERFTVDALQGLAKLYLGKTVIRDHVPSSANQTARIYSTEVVQDAERKTSLGEPYTALVSKAYMVRTDSNADLIKEIEAGIKKEVSVGCIIHRLSCSVCGNTPGKCRHLPGRTYDGVYCHTLLNDPKDAYEVSFVAVPSQRNAGTTKNHEDDPEDRTKDIALNDVFLFLQKQRKDD